MLIGTYNNKIDEKGRLRMPPKLKEELGPGYYVTRGDSNCLYAMSRDRFSMLSSKLDAITLTDPVAQKFKRQFYSTVLAVEEDNQGRFLLSPALRALAGITKDVVIIGAGDRVEIWSEERWKEYNESGDFDSFMSELAKYEI